eukprot:217516-Pleurochrysis_carterae.AAC.1
MRAAVRTREIDACKSLVALQTLSQRLAALVADAALPSVEAQAPKPKRMINTSAAACGHASSGAHPRD